MALPSIPVSIVIDQPFTDPRFRLSLLIGGVRFDSATGWRSMTEVETAKAAMLGRLSTVAGEE